jgi:hypothetical protein
VGFVVCAETEGPRHRLRHYRLEREPEWVDPITFPSCSRAGLTGFAAGGGWPDNEPPRLKRKG